MSFTKAPTGWTLGIDTSVAQGRLDVQALRDAGCAFVIARAAQGLHDVDGQWLNTSRACKDAGMPLGAYGVLIPYSSDKADDQARHFLDVIGDTELDLPCVLDFELSQNAKASDLLSAAQIWCDTVEASTGRQVIIYTGPSFIRGLAQLAGQAGEDELEALSTRPLWVAHYTQDFAKLPAVPKPWKNWFLWQASGDSRVCRNASKLPGTNTDVDIDLFFGTVNDLMLGPLSSPVQR